MKLKEFNLEIALKDPSQVVRGDGKQVVYLTERNSENKDYPLSVCFKDELGNLDTQIYTKEGIFSFTTPQDIPNNLFLKSKETTYWYNIYREDSSGMVWIGSCYTSEALAAKEAKIFTGSTFIDFIKPNAKETFIKTESFTVEE